VSIFVIHDCQAIRNVQHSLRAETGPGAAGWTSAAMLAATKAFRRLEAPQAAFGTADSTPAYQLEYPTNDAV
jgi:hypothetical protein